MTRWCLFLAVAAISAIAGCVPVRVDTFVERDVDLSRYRTFDWGPRESFITGDARLDDNPFFQRRLKAQVERRMVEHGFTKSPSPDLVVHYHASVSQKVDFNGLDPITGACGTMDCGPTVHDAGTLVLDLVEAGTNRLVWRGWADGPLAGAIDDQRWMEAHVDDAVGRILSRLPEARRRPRDRS